MTTVQIELPEWVIARLKQNDPDLSKAITDMVVWVDRTKIWMYQTDASLERIAGELAGCAK